MPKKSVKKSRRRKFGNETKGRCCDDIARLVQEINIKLNNLENFRKALNIEIPPSIKDARNLLNDTEFISSNVEDQYIKNLLLSLNKEISKATPDYEIVANDIVTIAKYVNDGNDVSDKFSGKIPRSDQDKGKIRKQIVTIEESDNKLRELQNLYKMIFEELPGIEKLPGFSVDLYGD